MGFFNILSVATHQNIEGAKNSNPNLMLHVVIFFSADFGYVLERVQKFDFILNAELLGKQMNKISFRYEYVDDNKKGMGVARNRLFHVLSNKFPQT